MATGTMTIVGDSVNGPRAWLNQNYTFVDEAWASPDGSTTGVSGTITPDNKTEHQTSFLLSNTPTDFFSMTGIELKVRYCRASTTDDTVGLTARIVKESDGTVLASAAAGAHATVVALGRDSAPGAQTYSTASFTSWTTVNSSATKADWDDARIEFGSLYSTNMVGDSAAYILVDTVEVVGTYTPIQAEYRSSTSILGATRTNTTLTKPTGLAVDDIMILCLDIEDNVTPTPPSGFTQLINIDHSSSTFDMWVWWKRATTTDVAAANFTVTHSSTWTAGYLVAVQRASTSISPVVSTAAQGTGTAATANSVTPIGDGAFVGLFIVTFGDMGFVAPPTGTTPTFTERLDAGGNIYTADGILVTAGATGSKTAGAFGNGSQQWTAVLVAVESSVTAGNVDATATPGVIAATAALPAAAGRGHKTVTPAVTAAVATMPAADKLLGATRTPAVTAAAVSLPGSVLSLGATRTPAVTATTVSMPQASGSASSPATATPATIAAIAALPASTRSLGADRTPAAIAATASLPASSRSLGATKSPAAITALVGMPQATGTSATIKTPNTIASVVGVPAAGKSAGATKSVATIATLVSMPAAAKALGATRTPAAIALLTTMPASTRSLGAGRVPATIAIVATLPQANPLTGADTFATPATIAVTVALPAATKSAGATKTPNTIASVVALPQAAIALGVVRTPDTIQVVIAVPLVNVTTGEGPSAQNPLAVAAIAAATHTVVIAGVTYAVIVSPTTHAAEISPQTNTVTI